MYYVNGREQSFSVWYEGGVCILKAIHDCTAPPGIQDCTAPPCHQSVMNSSGKFVTPLTECETMGQNATALTLI